MLHCKEQPTERNAHSINRQDHGRPVALKPSQDANIDTTTANGKFRLACVGGQWATARSQRETVSNTACIDSHQ
jgi:hypothetical protein